MAKIGVDIHELYNTHPKIQIAAKPNVPHNPTGAALGLKPTSRRRFFGFGGVPGSELNHCVIDKKVFF